MWFINQIYFLIYSLKILKNKKFNFFLVFENKPHQNALISAAKKINRENYITGYLAPLPWSFQADMIYKKNEIDRLLVGSVFQKRSLVKNLCWPSKKILVVPSFRYKKLKIFIIQYFYHMSFQNMMKKYFSEKLKLLLMKKT